MSTSEIVVKAEGVGKRYRLGVTDRTQLTDEFKAFMCRLRGKADPTLSVDTQLANQRVGEDFWALRDVSFEVRKGEVLGIIGHNGAGKSTLLKLLSRITLPTEGIIGMKGKVSSLLEVGTGFHPELSGRDNIYLNGAILGMRKAEVDAKLDDIVAFSGIEHHLDTPVKRYSSGMRVRLGFAVAAHLEPEVLIVDEVLSVGDAEFQRKSMGKMKDSAASGRTVLFVSHNMTAMRSLCDRVMWLDHGRVRMIGPTQEVVNAYLSNYTEDRTEVSWTDHATAPGNELAKLSHVRVRPASGGELFRWEDEIHVELAIDVLVDNGDDLNISLQVLSGEDMVVFASNLLEGCPGYELIRGVNTFKVILPGKMFNAGSFSINIGWTYKAAPSYRENGVVKFDMQDPPRLTQWHGKRAGVLRLPIEWRNIPTGANGSW